jgi:hypothetical protein
MQTYHTACTGKKVWLASDNIHDNFINIMDYDLIGACFPKKEWDKDACFMMGAAYPHDISVFFVEEHRHRYPPLHAVARRFGDMDCLMQYISRVDDLNISSEAKVMYEFFKEENSKK